MNPKSLFADDPWFHALQEVKDGEIGSVKAVSVLAHCAPGQLAQSAGEWQSRLDAAFGQPVNRDVLRHGHALSELVRYEGPIIGRLFIDEATIEPNSNFELVGTDGLLLWKPDVHPLSILVVHNRIEIHSGDVYPVRLEEMASS